MKIKLIISSLLISIGSILSVYAQKTYYTSQVEVSLYRGDIQVFSKNEYKIQPVIIDWNHNIGGIGSITCMLDDSMTSSYYITHERYKDTEGFNWLIAKSITGDMGFVFTWNREVLIIVMTSLLTYERGEISYVIPLI